MPYYDNDEKGGPGFGGKKFGYSPLKNTGMRIRIRSDPVIVGLPDPEPVLFSTDPDPDPPCDNRSIELCLS